MKKIICLIISALLLTISFVGCVPQPEEGIWQYGENYKNYSDMIDYARFAERLTGEDSPNKTDSLENGWNVGGTDLGFPIYDYGKNTMYYAFGDTFSTPNQSGTWRSNVLAISNNYDIKNGFAIDDFYKGGSGVAKAMTEGKHNVQLDTYEVTKIPTGGIVIGNNMYIFYMSIRRWNGWLVNYCGVIKSNTEKLNFERVYDLTWALTDGVSEVGANVGLPSNYVLADNDASLPILKRDILDIANQDIDGFNRTSNDKAYDGTNGIEGEKYVLDLENRVAPNFGQIFPIDGKDGYIYICGIPGGRSVGTKLGRVKVENFEDFQSYEYYTGTNKGVAQFVKGTDGLKAIFDNDDSFIIKEACGELSFAYNEYLGKWMSINAVGAGMHFRVADNIYGPYGAPQTILHGNDVPTGQGNIYGGAIHEMMTKDNGKTFYFVMSQWMPTYNSAIIEVRLK